MLNHISNTGKALEQNLTKTSIRIVTDIPYISIMVPLFLPRLGMYLRRFVTDLIPDQQNHFSDNFYKIFIQSLRIDFRWKFQLPPLTQHSIT